MKNVKMFVIFRVQGDWVMEIEKNGKIYQVKETSSKQIIKAMDGKVKLSYELSKNEFANQNEVETYFRATDI